MFQNNVTLISTFELIHLLRLPVCPSLFPVLQETAFRAQWGSGRPHVAVLCEYDALPELGHACGHNLIAEVGVAAGLGLLAALRSPHAAQHQGTVGGAYECDSGGIPQFSDFSLYSL